MTRDELSEFMAKMLMSLPTKAFADPKVHGAVLFDAFYDLNSDSSLLHVRSGKLSFVRKMPRDMVHHTPTFINKIKPGQIFYY